ncbi:MAG: response regulator transcription factor [Sphingomonadales bacterium]|nr:MAG: response regulator transcription factor [Sphingomonadales bacterium]TNF02197.1 MAG: response regulator transcription factor [Sphingomonadales bacterium]
MNENLPPLIHVVDDDDDLGAAIARLLVRHGYWARSFATPAAMLEACAHEQCQCVVTDVIMNEMDGFTLAEALREYNPAAAVIFMTAWPTTANAVDAVRCYGGLDYLEKPLDETRLLTSITEGVAWSKRRRAALNRLAQLTAREKQVLELLTAGMSNKVVAANLQISAKTVEDHRAAIMAKTGTNHISGLIALVRDASFGT